MEFKIIILWATFIVATIAFLVLYIKLIIATRKKIDVKQYELCCQAVYAGSPEDDHTDHAVVYPIKVPNNYFLDENDNPIDVDAYNGFRVEGDSMELANIKNGNLVFVPKSYNLTDDIPLPSVFVLQRECPSANEAQYKLRRVWAIAYLNKTNIESVLQGIIAHPVFQRLKLNEGVCQTDEQLLEEFMGTNGKLETYKNNHSHWNENEHGEERVVISTTLRKKNDRVNKGKHISLSIHPAYLVVGKVAYVYSLSNVSSMN